MTENAVTADVFPATYEGGVRVLEKAFRDCEVRLGRPATNVEVCEELGITLRELYEQLERYRGLNIGNVERAQSHSGSESERVVKYLPFAQPGEQISYLFGQTEFHENLNQAVNTLPKNEQLVVYLHYRQRLNLAEIAARIGISEGRVAQIHTTAMLRMRPKLLEIPGRCTGPGLFSVQTAPAA
jgi:RNA polymerase sigma factor FliA